MHLSFFLLLFLRFFNFSDCGEEHGANMVKEHTDVCCN